MVNPPLRNLDLKNQEARLQWLTKRFLIERGDIPPPPQIPTDAQVNRYYVQIGLSVLKDIS